MREAFVIEMLLIPEVFIGVFVTRIYALYQRNGRVMAFCAIVAGMLTPLCVVSE